MEYRGEGQIVERNDRGRNQWRVYFRASYWNAKLDKSNASTKRQDKPDNKQSKSNSEDCSDELELGVYVDVVGLFNSTTLLVRRKKTHDC